MGNDTTRKLKVRWSAEMSADLKAFHKISMTDSPAAKRLRRAGIRVKVKAHE